MEPYDTPNEVLEEVVMEEDFTTKTVHLKRTLRRRIPMVLVATFLYFLLRYIDPNIAFNPVHSRTFEILIIAIFLITLFIGQYVRTLPPETYREQSTYKHIKQLYSLFDFLSVIPYLMAIVSLMNTFLLSFSPISGSSMEPNFSDDEAVIFQHITHDYERFDVVILYVEDLDDPYLIKRVIGLPGETIVIDHNEVYIDGNLIAQDFIDQSTVETLCVQSTDRDYCSWIIPDDSYFVLGDNRDGSAIDSGFNGYSVDSRTFGPVSTDHIYGSVIFTFKDYNIMD